MKKFFITGFFIAATFVFQLFIRTEIKAQNVDPNDTIACKAALDDVNYSIITTDFGTVPIYDALKNTLQNNEKQGMIGCSFKKNDGSEIGEDWSLDYCAEQYCADKDSQKPQAFDHQLCKNIVMATIAYKVNGEVSSKAHIWTPGGIIQGNYDHTESFQHASDIFGSCQYSNYIQGDFLKIDFKGIKTVSGGQIACCVQLPVGKSDPVACSVQLQPCSKWNKDYSVYVLTDQDRSDVQNKGCKNQEQTYNSILEDMWNNRMPIKIGITEYNGDDKLALGIGALCASRSNITDANIKQKTDLWCPKLSEVCCQGPKATGCSGKFDVASPVLANNIFTQDNNKMYENKLAKRPTSISFRPTVGLPGTDFEGGQLTTIDSGTLGRFIGQFFGVALSVVAIFAILMIALYGAQMYFSAARGNIAGAAKAKDRIKGAITGLVFTLIAVTAFRFINPRLIELPSLTALSNENAIKKEAIDFPGIYDANTGSYEMPDDALVKKVLEYHNAGKISIQDKVNQNEAALKEIDANGLKLMLAMGDYAAPQNAGKDFNIRITALKKDHPVNTNDGNVSPHASGRGIDFGTGSGISKVNIEKLLVWLNSNKSQFKIGQIIYDSSVLSASYDRLKYNYDWRATPPPFKSTLLDDHRDHIHITILASDKAATSSGGSSQCGIFGKASGWDNTTVTDDKKQFLKEMVQAYNDAGISSVWPKEAMIAQAVIESRWGTSGQATGIQNYFGMKCTADMIKNEPQNCKNYEGKGFFRIYKDKKDNIKSYYNWINDGNNYPDNRTQVKKMISSVNFLDPCQAVFFGLMYPHKWTPDRGYIDSLMGVIRSLPKFKADVKSLNGNDQCTQDNIEKQFGSDVIQNYKVKACG